MKALSIAVLSLAALAAQPLPLRDAKEVQIEGLVDCVDLRPGLPAMEIRNRQGVHIVVLGSIRYLMERNFNPRAGEKVRLSGFSVEGRIYAKRIELPEQKIAIRLRDEEGYPLWRGRVRKE